MYSQRRYTSCPTYPSTSSKVESLTHGQLREMYVDFGLINALASEVLVHGVHRNTLVIHIRVLCDIETISLSRDSLQERRATTALVNSVRSNFSVYHLPPRPPQYHKHLSTLDQAIETSQDLDSGLFPFPNKPLDQVEWF